MMRSASDAAGNATPLTAVRGAAVAGSGGCIASVKVDSAGAATDGNDNWAQAARMLDDGLQ
jgi:hypothetical protein